MRHKLLEACITDLTSAINVAKIIKQLDPKCRRIVVSANIRFIIQNQLRYKWRYQAHFPPEVQKGKENDFTAFAICGIDIHSD